eukprot:g27247.t1
MFTPSTSMLPQRRPRPAVGMSANASTPKRIRSVQILQDTDHYKVETFIPLPHAVQKLVSETEKTLIQGRISRDGWCVLACGQTLITFCLRFPGAVSQLPLPRAPRSQIDATVFDVASVPERTCLLFVSTKAQDEALAGVAIISPHGHFSLFTDPASSEKRVIQHTLTLNNEEKATSLAQMFCSLLFVVGTSQGRLITVDFTSEDEDAPGLAPSPTPRTSELFKNSGYGGGLGIGAAVGWLFGSSDDTYSNSTAGGYVRGITSLAVGPQEPALCVLSDGNLSLWSHRLDGKAPFNLELSVELQLSALKSRITQAVGEDITRFYVLKLVAGRRRRVLLLLSGLTSNGEKYFVAEYLFASNRETPQLQHLLPLQGLDVHQAQRNYIQLDVLDRFDDDRALFVFGASVLYMLQVEPSPPSSGSIIKLPQMFAGGVWVSQGSCFLLSEGYGVFRATLKAASSQAKGQVTAVLPASASKPSSSKAVTSSASSSSSSTLSSPSQPASVKDETPAQMLKTAFHLYSTGLKDLSLRKVGQLLETVRETELLDQLVGKQSTWIIDARPFEGSNSGSLGNGDLMGSLLVDKTRMHNLFFKFLLEQKLWQQLSYNDGQRIMRTHGEKLLATAKLRQFLNTYEQRKGVDAAQMAACRSLVAPVMRDLVAQRGEKTLLRQGLSGPDAFYTRVSDVQALFRSLLERLQEYLVEVAEASAKARQNAARAVLVASQVYDVLLGAALTFRNQHQNLYLPQARDRAASSSLGVLPPEPSWSASQLSVVHEMVATKMAPRLGPAPAESSSKPTSIPWLSGNRVWDLSMHDALYQQLHCLSREMLELSRNHLRMLRDWPKLTQSDAAAPALKQARTKCEGEYQQLRRRVSSYLRAGARPGYEGHKRIRQRMAEDFLDFSAMVQLYKEEVEIPSSPGKDWEVLVGYLNEHRSNFAQELFQTFARKVRTAQLLTLTRRAGNTAPHPDFDAWLRDFLRPVPELSWLHAITMEQYGECAQLVARTAQKEEGLLRAMNLVSVSKLALLASDDGEQEEVKRSVAGLNDDLDVLRAQEDLETKELAGSGVAQVEEALWTKAVENQHALLERLLQAAAESKVELDLATDPHWFILSLEVYFKSSDLNSARPKQKLEAKAGEEMDQGEEEDVKEDAAAEGDAPLIKFWETVLRVDESRWGPIEEERQQAVDQSWTQHLSYTVLHQVAQHLQVSNFYGSAANQQRATRAFHAVLKRRGDPDSARSRLLIQTFQDTLQQARSLTRPAAAGEDKDRDLQSSFSFAVSSRTDSASTAAATMVLDSVQSGQMMWNGTEDAAGFGKEPQPALGGVSDKFLFTGGKEARALGSESKSKNSATGSFSTPLVPTGSRHQNSARGGHANLPEASFALSPIGTDAFPPLPSEPLTFGDMDNSPAMAPRTNMGTLDSIEESFDNGPSALSGSSILFGRGQEDEGSSAAMDDGDNFDDDDDAQSGLLEPEAVPPVKFKLGGANSSSSREKNQFI